MASDPNPKRAGVAGVTGAEPKSPLERAKQIQELQRQMESQPAQQAKVDVPAPVRAFAAAAQPAKKGDAVFEPKKLEATAAIGSPQAKGADQLGYGAAQVDEKGLFGLGQNNAPEVVGNPWRIIPFGDPPERQLAPLLDLKKPASEYLWDVPPNAVKIKQGHLFEVGVKPSVAAPSAEAAKRQAVIVDREGIIKGAEFKTVVALQKGFASFKPFTVGLFASVFGEGLTQDDPERMKFLDVRKGKKSAFEAVLEYRSPLDGKKREKTITLNNFGFRVAESNDPLRHDIIIRMYRLDSFEAAPAKQV